MANEQALRGPGGGGCGAWSEPEGFGARPVEEPPLPPASRRGFLTSLGIGAAASLAACRRMPVQHALPYLVPPEEITPGVPALYASTCQACPASCGLLVTVLDGRPVKLEGDPEHPLSGGGLCAMGQADIRALYDAGRLRGPRLGGGDVSWAALDEHVMSRLGELRASGRRLYVLAETLVSPTARETVEAFLAPFGGVLVEHDPGARNASATLDAYELLTGRPLVPALELEACDLLVVLGADLVGTGFEPVAHTRAYASRKRSAGEKDPFRHVQVEGVLSVTGAAADERLVVTDGGRRLVALGLLRRVAEHAEGPEAGALAQALASLPEPPHGDRVRRLAEELCHARGASLLVSDSSDVGEQLAVALANRLLGNEDKTLDLARPSLVRRGRDREMSAFLQALGKGEVGGVIILDLDPVDQLPEGQELAAALKGLSLSVAVTSRPTATASACQAVAAAHHGLESWADARPRAGVVTLCQPAIRPLFDTRHPLEALLRWSGAEGADARQHLMATWDRRAGLGAAFAATWVSAVRRASSPELSAAWESSLAATSATSGAPRPMEEIVPLLQAPAEETGLEAELIEEVALRDGRQAHVPWLRELPDPLTRVSWTPCARLAPQRARALGVKDGDLVKVEVKGHAVTLPARVAPGQHPDVVAVPLGYGRADADAGAAARNAYRLASRAEQGGLLTRGLSARLTAAGGSEALPLVQTESLTHGRAVVHQVGSYGSKVAEGHGFEGNGLWPERPRTSPQWEMVIDLDACTGCSACVVACQAENNLPVVGADEMRRHRDMYWLRIDRYYAGDEASPDVLFTPTLCAQCGNAPCETVCPVAATVHSEDGLNQQVYNRCVGTRYCANNCPYKVRRFNWFDHTYPEPVERLVLNPNVVVRTRGVMEKCTFCVQRIQAERIAARRDGRESWRGGDVRTACQQSCPARAIRFGDATDPDGEVAREKRSPRAYQVLADLGIKPSVTYVARVRSREGAGGAAHGKEGGA